MTEDAPHIKVECPFCRVGELDSQTGTAAHTAEQMVWLGIQCSQCKRSFTYTATRTPTPSPLVLPRVETVSGYDPS